MNPIGAPLDDPRTSARARWCPDCGIWLRDPWCCPECDDDVTDDREPSDFLPDDDRDYGDDD